MLYYTSRTKPTKMEHNYIIHVYYRNYCNFMFGVLCLVMQDFFGLYKYVVFNYEL